MITFQEKFCNVAGYPTPVNVVRIGLGELKVSHRFAHWILQMKNTYKYIDGHVDDIVYIFETPTMGYSFDDPLIAQGFDEGIIGFM